MSFTQNLVSELSDTHLLKHPFYQDWISGQLSMSDLSMYAEQYYHHVYVFPQYISLIHSKAKDFSDRQILCRNLLEEEMGENNHPELWMRFAEGMGATRESVENTNLLPETKDLVDGYFDIVKSSYAEGLGALFAYEQQVPEVAATKIEGLQKFYNVEDDRTLEFFKVHLEMDEYHSQEVAGLIEKLNDVDKERARQAAVKASKLLWAFLDGVQKERAA